SVAIVTSHGGKTSHAAVVARGMGTTCVCGADAIEVDQEAKLARVGETVIQEGDLLSVDGSTGEVFLGQLPVVPSSVVTYLEKGLAAAISGVDAETAALIRSVD